MKSVIAIIFALTCICFVIQECKAHDLKTHMREVSQMCQNREQTTDEIVEKIRSGEYDANDVERLAKCHVKCMMEGFGAMENGSLSEKAFVHKLAPHIGEAKAREMFDFCKDESGGEDECDKPFKIYLCLKKLSDIFKY
uniref:OBP29 n=2 Tax=Syrphini TaxID=115274 RepID=A0A6H0D4C9_EPIBA|nr:OBP29 [Episyrphus balteatus]